MANILMLGRAPPARNEAEKPSDGVAVGGQAGVPGVHHHGDARLVDPGPERVEHVGGRRERARRP